MATYTKETALFDTGAIANDINAVQGNVAALSSDVSDYQANVSDSLTAINNEIYGADGTEGLQNLLNQAISNIGELSANYNVLWGNVDSFMEFGTDGQGNPILTLGSKNSPFRVNITNQMMQFMYGTTPIAFITGTALRVQNQLSFGNFIFYQRDNGHLTIKYIGG